MSICPRCGCLCHSFWMNSHTEYFVCRECGASWDQPVRSERAQRLTIHEDKNGQIHLKEKHEHR